MTYKDQSYYKEFRDLLNRLQSSVSSLKDEKERLSRENRALSQQLREVRAQLTEAHKEIDELKKEVQEARRTASEQATGSGISGVEHQKADAISPSLFDNVSDNEKFVLRQQINELISRIDHHLAKSGDS